MLMLAYPSPRRQCTRFSCSLPPGGWQPKKRVRSLSGQTGAPGVPRFIPGGLLLVWSGLDTALAVVAVVGSWGGGGLSGFRVVTEGLSLGSAVIAAGGSVVGAGGLGGVSGAAAQTPVAGVWGEFVGRAGRALIDADEVSGDLVRALSEAARAYQLSDQAAAASMAVGG